MPSIAATIWPTKLAIRLCFSIEACKKIMEGRRARLRLRPQAQRIDMNIGERDIGSLKTSSNQVYPKYEIKSLPICTLFDLSEIVCAAANNRRVCMRNLNGVPTANSNGAGNSEPGPAIARTRHA